MIQQELLGGLVESTCLGNQKTRTLVPELLFNWFYNLGFTIYFSGLQLFVYEMGYSFPRLFHNSNPTNLLLDLALYFIQLTILSLLCRFLLAPSSQALNQLSLSLLKKKKFYIILMSLSVMTLSLPSNTCCLHFLAIY